MGTASLSIFHLLLPCAVLGVVINANIGEQRGPIPKTWSALITWDYTSWRVPFSVKPNYPFVDTVQLFTATGGCYSGFPGCSSNRDMFVDPKDPGKGYNFTQMFAPLHNMVQQGLRPYIVTGNVPIALSTNPHIGGFGVNDQPPASYPVYSAYIAALASALVTEFGLSTVQGWKWGVLTEFNNQDWFKAPPPAYFQLYDWTACALDKALNGKFEIGAHACTQCTGGGSWDPLLLIPHVVNGTNYCTGKKGSKLDFFSNSFYETAPGKPGDLSAWDPAMDSIINAVHTAGLQNVQFGWDEGRILSGPDGLALTSRAIGQTYQASFDALAFKKVATAGLSWYARWNVNSDGVVDSDLAVDTVATNVAFLSSTLVGMQSAAVSSPPPGKDGDIVDAVVGFESSTKTIRALVFRHNPKFPNSLANADVQTVVCGLGSTPSNLPTKMWLVDDNHAQFWPQWWADKAAHNITQITWSPYSDYIGFTSPTAMEYFKGRVSLYRQLAQRTSVQVQSSVASGCVTFTATLQGNSVALFEASFA